MKRLILFVLFFCIEASSARSGHWVGNGGDSLAMSIFHRAEELQQSLATLKPACANDLKFSADQFAAIFKNKLTVNTTPEQLQLIIDGQPVYKEAINDPDTNSVVFNRDAYRSSPNKDQLILHEMMGLARLDDSNGIESTRTAEALANPNCQMNPSAVPGDAPMALGNGEIPVASQMDRDGVIYFQVVGRKLIYRYSVAEHQYLSPLETRDFPLAFAVAPASNRIYVAYRARSITYFDLRNAQIETDFATVQYIQEPWEFAHDMELLNRREIGEFFVSGQTLVIAPDDPYSDWRRYVYYGPTGQRTGQTTWVSPNSGIAASANGRDIFYISGFNAVNHLSYTAFNKDDQPTERDGVHVEGFNLRGPIALAPGFIALGSGLVLHQSDRSLAAQLGETFETAAWLGKTLYVSHATDQGFVVRGFTAPKFQQTFEKVYDSGSLIALHAYGSTVVMVWVTDEGDVQIDEIVN